MTDSFKARKELKARRDHGAAAARDDGKPWRARVECAHVSPPKASAEMAPGLVPSTS